MAETTSKQIGVRVPMAMSERLNEVARREGNHVSAVTRRLLSAALDREDAASQLAPPPHARSASSASVRRV